MRSTNALYKCTKALAACYCNATTTTTSTTVSRAHQSNKVHKSITSSKLGTTTTTMDTGHTTSRNSRCRLRGARMTATHTNIKCCEHTNIVCCDLIQTNLPFSPLHATAFSGIDCKIFLYFECGKLQGVRIRGAQSFRFLARRCNF